VINYSLPDELENYTHRSGRTARAGKTGVSISIINSKEISKIKQIERSLGKRFTACEIPGGFEICEKQLFSLVHKVHEVVVNEEQISQYMPRIEEEFKDLTKEDLIRRFSSIEFNRFLNYYSNAPDLNVPVDFKDRAKADDRIGRSSAGVTGFENSPGSNADFTRLFINLGSVDEFTRGDLLRFICDQSGIQGTSIGKIDLKGVYSFFEVENRLVDKVFEGFKTAQFQGRTVRVEVSQDGDRKREDRKFSPRPAGGYGGTSGGAGRRHSDGESGAASSRGRREVGVNGNVREGSSREVGTRREVGTSREGGNRRGGPSRDKY